MKLLNKKIHVEAVAQWIDCAARWCLLMASVIAIGLLFVGFVVVLWKTFNHDIVTFLMVLVSGLAVPSTFWIMIRDPNQ